MSLQTIRIGLLALLCLFLIRNVLFPQQAFSGVYLNSAHGNTNYGVNRAGLAALSFQKGHCVHCHEQHASIEGIEPEPSGSTAKYALFYDSYVSQTSGFCLKCHDGTNGVSVSAITNRSYSYRAGGWTLDTVGSILTAFSNPPSISSHSPSDIRTFINGNWGYTVNSNPCVACHSPHAAQGDPANSGNSAKSAATRGYPAARPSQHASSTWQSWGGSAGQSIKDYAGAKVYQAPYRYNSIVAFEPDGSNTQDGSNLADYATLCIDCHNATNTIYSTALGRNLYKIDWSTEAHGKGTPSLRAGFTNLKAPYQDAQMGNYVLSCTDCHEGHGSPNNFLIRREVNGSDAVTVTHNGVFTGPFDRPSNTEWMYLCQRCHANLEVGNAHTHPQGGALGCNCHGGGAMYQNCQDCHFHGNSSIAGVPYGKPLF